MGQGIVKGLAHIGIFVKDLDASVEFYKRLGFSLDKVEGTGTRLGFVSAGNCFIEFIEQKDMAPRPAGVVDHIAMEVDDIADAVARAKAAGINIDETKISYASLLGGIKNVFFDGPDGERLEFFEYVLTGSKGSI
jgi:lactoylglutathione lyase